MLGVVSDIVVLLSLSSFVCQVASAGRSATTPRGAAPAQPQMVIKIGRQSVSSPLARQASVPGTE